MCVSRCEQAKVKAVDDGVTHCCAHHKFAETESAVALIDKDVTQPRERRFIGHPPSEAHLGSVGEVATDDDGTPKGALDLIEGPTERPVALLTQPAMYLGHVEAILVITHDVSVVTNSFHARSQ